MGKKVQKDSNNAGQNLGFTGQIHWSDMRVQIAALTPHEPRPAVVCDGVVIGRTAPLEFDDDDVDGAFPAAARENASLSLSLAGRMLDMVGPFEESVDFPDVIVYIPKEEDMSCAFFSVVPDFPCSSHIARMCVDDVASTK